MLSIQKSYARVLSECSSGSFCLRFTSITAVERRNGSRASVRALLVCRRLLIDQKPLFACSEAAETRGDEAPPSHSLAAAAAAVVRCH